MHAVRLPAEVDGIFIGGGHNALVAAGYLARAGIETLILESQPAVGGGLQTAEITLPLFRHNLGTFFSRWTPNYRIWKDLELSRYGLDAIVPEAQLALPLREGGGLVMYRDLDKSLLSIARLSPRDARIYAGIHEEFSTLAARIVTPLRFSAPLAADELDGVLRRSALGRRFLEIARRPPLELVRELFEHEVVRAAVLFNVATRAYLPLLDTPGTGYSVVLAVPACHGTALVRGGSREAARALTAHVFHHGGLVASRTRVARILVNQGRAFGVELEDGRRIRARRFVCSSLPAAVTLGALVEPQHLNAEFRTQILAYPWHEDCLFGVHLALREGPCYRGTEADLDLNQALSHCVGYESSQSLERDMRAIRDRRIPAARAFQAAVPSLFDPSQAPPGHATAFAWQFVPRLGPDGEAPHWSGPMAEELASSMLTAWQDYAPNLARAEIGRAVFSPQDTADSVPSMVLGDRHHGSYHPDNFDANRPHPDLSGYRTPILGLYHCGASTYPGGSFTGQPGYNAAAVIARDLGHEPWWRPLSPHEALPES